MFRYKKLLFKNFSLTYIYYKEIYWKYIFLSIVLVIYKESEFTMITQAYAASHPGGGDSFLQLLPFLLIFLIIYFLILRPQQKRVKAHKEMIDSLKKGDTVITQGGLIGKISKIISDQEVEIEIAKDVKVKAVRGMISDIKK